jgi:hypothetical protein
MISSTALDLPEHRRHARDACERMSMLPLVMEQMPASPADAATESRRMVEEADFYLGIIAFRYGTILEQEDKSITELEYDRAMERQIPIFIFIAHDEHPVSFRDVEKGAGAPKLEALKERLRKAHVVRTFRSAEELRTEIISTLAAHRGGDTTKPHYIAEIPPPPAPWVAHPYTLLGNRPLVGRRDELNLLTDWVAKPSSAAYHARLLALVAIGGMGKSALTWYWWNEIAPEEMKPLAGRMWWGFYESDARLENFTARALAYLTGRPRTETEKIPMREREDQLLAILDSEPHLVVLDGLERELIAYARMDAAHLSDEDLDAKTAHMIARRTGLPDIAQTSVSEAKLRQTADPRTGHFLRRCPVPTAVDCRGSPAIQSPRGISDELRSNRKNQASPLCDQSTYRSRGRRFGLHRHRRCGQSGTWRESGPSKASRKDHRHHCGCAHSHLRRRTAVPNGRRWRAE